MKSVTWIGFCYNFSNLSVILHFFPNSQSSMAPYVVNTNIEIFGSGMTKKQIEVDGLRLGQPDGVRVVDLFPELKRTNLSLFAIKITFSSTQSHIDLENSDCIIEFEYPTHSMKYRPEKIGVSTQSDVWLTKYNDLHANLILINYSDLDILIDIYDKEYLLTKKSILANSISEEKLDFNRDVILKASSKFFGFIILGELETKQLISVRKL